MRGRLAIVGALMAVAAACSFSSPLDDREGFLGPPPPVDGAIPVFDGSFSGREEEGSDDAAMGAVTDATTDADGDAAIVDAGTARPCDATFCEDFDFGALGASWSAMNGAAAAGKLELVEAGRSDPFALRVTTYGGPLEYRNLDLAKQFGIVKTAACSFAVKPIERPGRPAVFFFRGLTVSSDNWYAWVTLASTETTLGLAVFFKDGGAPLEAIASAPVAPVGEWTDLAVATLPTKLTLAVGGAPAAELPMKFGTSGAGFSAHVGIQVIETTQEVVLFDDIRCDVTQ